MYGYRELILDENVERRRYPESQYYFQKGGTYQTLPSKRTQFFQELNPERSVTPDITRGLERNTRRIYQACDQTVLTQKLGIPVKIPDVGNLPQKVPSYRFTPPRETVQSEKPNISPHDTTRISPIDPRSSCGFQSSTPSSKELKAAANLESRLLSPKKSTMSNEELYAVIHKSKKKMNIGTEEPRASPVSLGSPKTVRSPETGYIGDRSRSRLSWSPSKGEYVDFNSDIDKLSPPNESRSRQSWACSDRKGAQTSRMDFKRLLLQKSNVLGGNTKKLSAVEQLKLSKQQIQKPPPPMNILELSGSPRSLVNRKFSGTSEKAKPAPKLMSPRSQWRFANPRTDVLSSTILEDCREDESPNNSMEKKSKESVVKAESPTYSSITQKLQAQRAQFFGGGTSDNNSQEPFRNSQFRGQHGKDKCSVPPTLETAF